MRKWLTLTLVLSMLLLPSMPVHGASTAITATIRPVRVLIVNDQQVITAIYTNTPDDVRPTIEMHGDREPLTPQVEEQYQTLLPILRLMALKF